MSESYKGIKFKARCIGNETVSHPLLCDLIRWCKLFSDKGFTPSYPGGSSGNLSIRVRNGENAFIITGSYTNLGSELTGQDFVEVTDCSQEKMTVTYRGIKKPSSETLMHAMIYRNFPFVNAVFHGHSETIMIKAVELGFPITKEEIPYGTPELAQTVSETLTDRGLVIIKNHGFVSVGQNPEEAGMRVLKLTGRH